MSETITPLIQKYTIDFASNNNFLFVKGIQGDGYGTRYVDISLFNNGQPYLISSDTVRAVLRGTKPDNKNVFNQCKIIDNNTIRAEITQQMSAVPGKSDYEISIMSLTENRSLTSFPFFIMIYESTFDIGYVVSSDEFGLLVEKINQSDKLNADITKTIEEANETIDACNSQTEQCSTATNNANTAIQQINQLHDTISVAENQRIENENTRQTNTATAIANANKATQDAIDQIDVMNTLEQSITASEAARVNDENLRQQNTANAIKNAEKATQNATVATSNANTATTNANEATSEAQKRIDLIDSLEIETVTQNAINATSNANTATASTETAIANAQKATQDAIEAVENIKNTIGIDDTQTSESTTWSSKNISSKINEAKTESQRYKIPSLTILQSNWKNNVVYIKSDRILSDSVIDIYYNSNSLNSVADFNISYIQGNGYIKMTSEFTPYGELQIDCIMIENYNNACTGSVSNVL